MQVHPASPMPDIDSADADDPLQASDLACEIFAYYKRMEAVYRPLPTYMSRQVGAATAWLPHDCMTQLPTSPPIKVSPRVTTGCILGRTFNDSRTCRTCL